MEGAVASHRVHRDGELAGDRDTRLGVALGLRQLQTSCLDRVTPLEPREHRRCRFVERAAHVWIARLADAALHIDR